LTDLKSRPPLMGTQESEAGSLVDGSEEQTSVDGTQESEADSLIDTSEGKTSAAGLYVDRVAFYLDDRPEKKTPEAWTPERI
jgi:hypothetical protein